MLHYSPETHPLLLRVTTTVTEDWTEYPPYVFPAVVETQSPHPRVTRSVERAEQVKRQPLPEWEDREEVLLPPDWALAWVEKLAAGPTGLFYNPLDLAHLYLSPAVADGNLVYPEAARPASLAAWRLLPPVPPGPWNRLDFSGPDDSDTPARQSWRTPPPLMTTSTPASLPIGTMWLPTAAPGWWSATCSVCGVDLAHYQMPPSPWGKAALDWCPPCLVRYLWNRQGDAAELEYEFCRAWTTWIRGTWKSQTRNFWSDRWYLTRAPSARPS